MESMLCILVLGMNTKKFVRSFGTQIEQDGKKRRTLRKKDEQHLMRNIKF